MRPWWLPCLLLLSCGSGKKPLGTTTDAGMALYTNDDALTVLSPRVAATHTVSEDTVVGLGWQADIISAATIDVISSATEPFEDTRHEASATVTQTIDDIALTGSYFGSTENDTTTHTAAANSSVQLFGRNLTLGLGYNLGLARIGTINEAPELWRGKTAHRIDATAAQNIDASTVASVSYTFQHDGGFLASAYRRVPIFPGDEALQVRSSAQWVAERHPDARGRHAFTLEGRRALSNHLFLRETYRGYLDTWAMRANTNELALGTDWGHGLLMAVSGRVHWQSSVSFYRSIYTVNRDYITADRRLGKLVSLSPGLEFRFNRDPWRAVLSSKAEWTRYADAYVLQSELSDVPNTTAIITEFSVARPF